MNKKEGKIRRDKGKLFITKRLEQKMNKKEGKIRRDKKKLFIMKHLERKMNKMIEMNKLK